MVGEICFRESLVDAAREVFETMMFMALEVCEETEDVVEGEMLLSSITFRGNLEGCLGISCGMDDAKVISANMLGMEPEDEMAMEDISDALGEVANMVLGSFKKRVLDEVGELNVSIPCVVKGRMLDYSLGEDAEKFVQYVNLDGSMVKFELLYRQVG